MFTRTGFQQGLTLVKCATGNMWNGSRNIVLILPGWIVVELSTRVEDDTLGARMVAVYFPKADGDFKSLKPAISTRGCGKL